MHRPNIRFRKAGGTQTILVGHHNQLVIELPGYAPKVGQYLWVKTEFLKAVDLLVCRLQNYGTIAVYEQHFLFR